MKRGDINTRQKTNNTGFSPARAGKIRDIYSSPLQE